MGSARDRHDPRTPGELGDRGRQIGGREDEVIEKYGNGIHPHRGYAANPHHSRGKPLNSVAHNGMSGAVPTETPALSPRHRRDRTPA